MKFRYLVLFIIVLSSLSSSYDMAYGDSEEQPIPLGKDCTVISAPGNYILDQDMIRRPEVDGPKTDCSPDVLLNKSNIPNCYRIQTMPACLLIEASNVSVDCKGHKVIIGDWVLDGIAMGMTTGVTPENVSIRNCIIDRPRVGISTGTYSSTLRGDDLFLENNSIYDALSYGYYFDAEDSILDCRGQKITMDSSGIVGMYLLGTKNMTVSNCIMENGATGILSSGVGIGNTYDNNSVFNTTSQGYFFGDMGSIITNNLYAQQGPGGVDGFHMAGSNNSIIGNAASGANGSCFNIESASGDKYASNKAEQCNIGFHVGGGNNTFTSNEATGNRLDGFLVERDPRIYDNATGNVFQNNTARDNGRYGYNLDDSKNSFGSNVDEGNAYGSLFNDPWKEIFDGISIWFRGLFGG